MPDILKCINQSEAAKLIGVTTKDLALWREASCGPDYYLLPPLRPKGKGRPVYGLEELQQWVLRYKIITERPEVSGAKRYLRVRRNARRLIRQELSHVK